MTLADYVIIWTENVPDRKDLARSAQGFLQVLIRFPRTPDGSILGSMLGSWMVRLRLSKSRQCLHGIR